MHRPVRRAMAPLREWCLCGGFWVTQRVSVHSAGVGLLPGAGPGSPLSPACRSHLRASRGLGQPAPPPPHPAERVSSRVPASLMEKLNPRNGEEPAEVTGQEGQLSPWHWPAAGCPACRVGVATWGDGGNAVVVRSLEPCALRATQVLWGHLAPRHPRQRGAGGWAQLGCCAGRTIFTSCLPAVPPTETSPQSRGGPRASGVPGPGYLGDP